MRMIRIVSVVFFVITLGAYGIYNIFGDKEVDGAGPQITMEGDSITVSAIASDAEILSHVQAIDEKDGDVSKTLIVESMTNFIQPGRRNVTLAAWDSDNNVTKFTTQLVYNDYKSPTFSLTGPLRFPLSTENVLGVVRVYDMLDGTLTSNVKIESNCYIDIETEGNYPVIFVVANSAGDVVELPATVEIYNAMDEYNKPQIHLSQYLVQIQQGDEFDPWDYVEEITVGDVSYVRSKNVLKADVEEVFDDITTIRKSDVKISKDFNTDEPGVYEVVYQYSHQDENPGIVRLVVVVNE